MSAKGWTEDLRDIQAVVAARQERERLAEIEANGPLLAEFVRWCPKCMMKTTHGCSLSEPLSEAVRCTRCRHTYTPKKGTLCQEQGE